MVLSIKIEDFYGDADRKMIDRSVAFVVKRSMSLGYLQ